MESGTPAPYIKESMAAPKKTTQSDPSAPSPRDAILAAAIEAITHHGESAVRITDVARTAGVTQGMISYYFKDREGLIAEAHLVIFERGITQDSGLLLSAVEAAQTPEDFQAVLAKLNREIVSSQRAVNRISRTVVLGSALNRPELLERVNVLQEQLIDDLELIATKAQQKGLFRSDIAPRAIGAFVTSYALGLIVADMDTHRPADEDLAKVIDLVMLSLRPQ
jgi:AcrR family transcriptional regulator